MPAAVKSASDAYSAYAAQQVAAMPKSLIIPEMLSTDHAAECFFVNA
jgi:hypothetical protein